MLLLSRSQIAGMMTPDDYLRVVEEAFRAHHNGAALQPALSHVDAEHGEFHIKAGGLLGPPAYFALKVNGGFFGNRVRHGLPNIQGLIVLSDASTGTPLAAMDSIEITIQRTGAATAVAAKYLALPYASVCTVCGGGTQGRIQLRSIHRVRPLKRAFVWSRSSESAAQLASEMSAELRIPVEPEPVLERALEQSELCVTCTPSRTPFLKKGAVRPGTFIAAVGADSPDKQELDAELVASSAIIADIREQAIAVGETHHAIRLGLMTPDQLRGTLGEVIAGRTGRRSADEIVIFDSTGTALQDSAAAAAVYERARAAGIAAEWSPVA
jgi:ornithine cyclodeaminase/alanine dehydrogenase